MNRKGAARAEEQRPCKTSILAKLERDSEAELDSPGRCDIAVPVTERRACHVRYECGSACATSRTIEAVQIPDVEGLYTELEPYLLCKLRILHQAQVLVCVTRTAEI